MAFTFNIPNSDGALEVAVEPGTSAIFVGANGGGKTRLSVHIENSLQDTAHRISAHRALSLNPAVAKISERDARTGLRFGSQGDHMGVRQRAGSRWQSKGATSLLNDFDFLVQVLFAEQSNVSLVTHQRNRSGNNDLAEPTKFEILQTIWERLLPTRQLDISGDDIVVSVEGIANSYPASDMSDGERAIFYLIGQTLVVEDDSLLIIDEPELHVHRSIMSKLWDELEAVRPDCGFVFITHDLEFAASREAQKFAINKFEPTPTWNIEKVPAETGFSEEITTLILGSRRPILFVEGTGTSLDVAIYRYCFPDWTVVPKGSCEEVIHSVSTMRNNDNLTRITCSGIVDADDHSAGDIENLTSAGVSVLPVSEIENLVLLPIISRKIAKTNGYEGAELDAVLETLKTHIFEAVGAPGAVDRVVAQYCRRRIDRMLKKIDLSGARTVDEISEQYRLRTAELDVDAIGQQVRSRIENAIENQDLVELLANYDDKGLIALAARDLKNTGLKDFKQWLNRSLRNDSAPELVGAFHSVLPDVEAR